MSSTTACDVIQRTTDHQDDDDQLAPPDDFICPITQAIFRDPVQDIFGHTYERSAILAWISATGTCPLTRRVMQPSDLIPNVLMKTKVRLWQVEHHQVPQITVGNERKSLFCIYDEEDSNDNIMLFGYVKIPQKNNIASRRTTHSERQRPRRRRWLRATHPSNATGTGGREQFLSGGEVEPRQEQSFEGFRVDRLLAEYEQIIEEEENRARRRRA